MSTLLGSVQKFTTTGNATTGKSGTATIPTGDRRGLFVFASRGYVNDVVDVLPDSFTMGGQTVSAVTPEEYGLGNANSGSRLYFANEATIAAMASGAFAMTYDTELELAYEISVSMMFREDVDQTAGIVDFDSIDSAEIYGTTKGAALTTVAGDECFAFGDSRADQSANSSYAGHTNVDTLTADASGDQATKSNQRIDTITASGSSTNVVMTMGDGENGAVHVIAIRTDEGAGATAPDPPTGLTATKDGSSAVDLSWSAPGDDGGSSITGYKIEREVGIGNGWSTLVADTGGTGTTYEDTSVDPGQEYNYRVSALNAVGESDPSTADSATTDAVSPGAPTGLTATAASSTQINLSWSAPASTGGSPITGYRIERESPTGNGFSELVADTGSTSTTYNDTGLTPETEYNYRVSAINAAGTGTASSSDDATTTAAPSGGPTSDQTKSGFRGMNRGLNRGAN